MEVVAYKISPLARRDLEFMQIQRLIDTKKHFLIEKQKKLRFITKQNRFLEEVKSDYSKYYQVISKQKEDQIKALELINQYIQNLTISGQLSKQNIKETTTTKSAAALIVTVKKETCLTCCFCRHQCHNS